VALGLYVESGSKYEDAMSAGAPFPPFASWPHPSPLAAGAAHVLDRLAFKATQHRSAFRLTREAEVIGANLLAGASREQFSFTVDVLRTHLPEATELLLDAALNPKFELHTLRSAVDAAKAAAAEAADDAPGQLLEALHAAAYGPRGLGRPLAADAAALDALTPDAMAAFVSATFTAPRLALSCSGASLAALSAVAEPLLSALPSAPPPPRGAAVDGAYVGGELRSCPGGARDGATHIALGFHFAGGWRDVRGATAMTVLQVLLGGGGSFSAGGPGKGLYSRLYRNVLNKHAWAHACTGFHALYNDSGLVGITAACDPARAGDAVDVIVSELLTLASAGPSPSELARAKAATASSVLMNLESRAVVAEDIGRQLLTYGERKPPSTFLAEVERLQPADMAAAVAKLLKSAPSLAVVGDASALPRYEAIARRF